MSARCPSIRAGRATGTITIRRTRPARRIRRGRTVRRTPRIRHARCIHRCRRTRRILKLLVVKQSLKMKEKCLHGIPAGTFLWIISKNSRLGKKFSLPLQSF